MNDAQEHVQAIRTAQAQLITDGHEDIARSLDAALNIVRATSDLEAIARAIDPDAWPGHGVPQMSTLETMSVISLRSAARQKAEAVRKVLMSQGR